MKYKLNRSQEFVIGGYTAGNPFDALIVGCYDGGKLRYVGKVRNGLPHMRCAMVPLFKELSTDKCPFVDLPEKRRTLYSLTRDEMQNCQWLKPLLVARLSLRSGRRTGICTIRVLWGGCTCHTALESFADWFRFARLHF